jgi:hypothetical protein
MEKEQTPTDPVVVVEVAENSTVAVEELVVPVEEASTAVVVVAGPVYTPLGPVGSVLHTVAVSADFGLAAAVAVPAACIRVVVFVPVIEAAHILVQDWQASPSCFRP